MLFGVDTGNSVGAVWKCRAYKNLKMDGGFASSGRLVQKTAEETEASSRPIPQRTVKIEEKTDFIAALRDMCERNGVGRAAMTYNAGSGRSPRLGCEPFDMAQPNASSLSVSSAAAGPGANSRGIADALGENPNRFLDACGDGPARHYFDLDGNVLEAAEEYAAVKEEAWNCGFMRRLEGILEKNGIKLADGETFNISVDKYGSVSVTGDNGETAAAIETILNSMPDGNEKWGLTLNRNSIREAEGVLPRLFKNMIEYYSANAVTGKGSIAWG